MSDMFPRKVLEPQPHALEQFTLRIKAKGIPVGKPQSSASALAGTPINEKNTDEQVSSLVTAKCGLGGQRP